MTLRDIGILENDLDEALCLVLEKMPVESATRGGEGRARTLLEAGGRGPMPFWTMTYDMVLAP